MSAIAHSHSLPTAWRFGGAVSEGTVICTECGKEVPTSSDVCQECGARHFRGRAPRKGPRRTAASAADGVAALADAVRSVPKLPAKKRSSYGVKRRSKRRAVRSSREQRPDEPAESRTEKDAPAASEADAADAHAPHGVRRVSRRKVYHYSKTKRKTFIHGTELRAMILVLAVGLVLVLMCHMQQSGAAQIDAGAESLSAPIRESGDVSSQANTTQREGVPATRHNSSREKTSRELRVRALSSHTLRATAHIGASAPIRRVRA